MHSNEERKTKHVFKKITTSVSARAILFLLFCHKLECLHSATPTFEAEASQFLLYMGVHTHTVLLAFIRTHITAARRLSYLMIQLALFDKVLRSTFKTHVLGKLGSELFERTRANRNCTARYTTARTETLKQSLRRVLLGTSVSNAVESSVTRDNTGSTIYT